MQRRKFDILFIAVSLLLAFSSFPQTHAAETRFTVVIDAGHGGNDPGAIGRRGKEKNINLSVALKLGRLIRQNCPDTRVVYTRERDVFVPLHRRAEIANDAKADLFISIHTNSVASRNRSVSGTETYTLGLHRTQENLEVAKKENAVILIEDDYKQRYAGFNPNSSESYIIFEFLQDKNMAQSVSFATSVQKCFRNANRTDKGVHQAGFLVLRATSMPSVLIELGYITNPTEEAYLMSEQGSSTLAKSIYRAFLNYKGGKVSSAQLAAEPETMPTPAEEETAAAPQPQAQAVRTQAPPQAGHGSSQRSGKAGLQNTDIDFRPQTAFQKQAVQRTQPCRQLQRERHHKIYLRGRHELQQDSPPETQQSGQQIQGCVYHSV